MVKITVKIENESYGISVANPNSQLPKIGEAILGHSKNSMFKILYRVVDIHHEFSDDLDLHSITIYVKKDGIL